MKSPVAGARYLRALLDAFVEVILRFNRKSQRPYRGGGIFGVIEWFFHSVEETGRKILHAHGIARAASSPKTFQEAHNLEEEERQAELLCKFSDSVLKAELPIENPHKCRNCLTDLTPCENVPAKTRIYGAIEPFIYDCDRRKKSYTPSLLNKLELKSLYSLQSVIDMEIPRENSAEDYVQGISLGFFID